MAKHMANMAKSWQMTANHGEWRRITANDGKSWQVFYTVRDNDNGLAEWSISNQDRAGNLVRLDPSVNYLAGLVFNTISNETFEADTTPPQIIDVSITNTNPGTKFNHPEIQLAKAGDNITVEFELDEPIHQPILSFCWLLTFCWGTNINIRN